MTVQVAAHPPQDGNLRDIAQGADVSAFNQWVLLNQKVVYNVAYRILGDPDAAADATQDTFLKAYQNLPRFRGGSSRAWLLRIVTTTCYDHLRYRRRRPEQSLDERMVEADHLALLADAREPPDALALRGELADLIQSCILRLPPDQRVTLVLADIQGLTYDETAHVTGVSIGTVKSRLSRARARVRDALLANGDLLPDRYRQTNLSVTSPHQPSEPSGSVALGGERAETVQRAWANTPACLHRSLVRDAQVGT